MNKEANENQMTEFNEINTNTNSNMNINNVKKRSFLDSSNRINLNKSNDNETSFGDFVLMMDNKDEYKKMVINNGKRKVWKAINKIRKSKDINKIFKDPSSTKWYIINPDQNKCKPVFDSLFCLLLYIDFIFSPFEFFVYKGDYKFYRIVIFDIFFTLEIISQFFISYYDTENKFYITDIKKIFFHYLKSGFIPSLIYVFPFYIFYPELEMLRLIKLYRYPYVNDKIRKLTTWFLSFIVKNVTICSQIVRVFAFFLSICYITHVCACFYCFLGLRYNDGWIANHSDELNLDKNNILDIYVSSYYFLTETLSSTGYGDLTPINTFEIAFIMFCEIITCGLYAYLLSNILDILLNKDNSDSYKFRANQINLENWIMYYIKKLPATSKKDNLHRNKIWEETKKYYELYYCNTKNFTWIQYNNFISQMKPSQRNELMSNSFKFIFNKFYSFFKRIKLLSSKIKIVMNFKTSIEVAKTEIINNWKKIHKIYFIDRGIINVYRNGQLIYSLTDGYFFGIEAFLKDDSNKHDKISYVVSNECPYAIIFSIKIPFLMQEILNYDNESFIGIINLANHYIDNILNGKKDDIFLVERQESVDELDKISNKKRKKTKNKKSFKDNVIDENEINTNSLININTSSTNSNNISNDDDINRNNKRKLNLDLLQPGCLPELDKKFAEYQRAEKVANESNLKIDLINKQINFINKYMNQLVENK